MGNERPYWNWKTVTNHRPPTTNPYRVPTRFGNKKKKIQIHCWWRRDVQRIIDEEKEKEKTKKKNSYRSTIRIHRFVEKVKDILVLLLCCLVSWQKWWVPKAIVLFLLLITHLGIKAHSMYIHPSTTQKTILVQHFNLDLVFKTLLYFQC